MYMWHREDPIRIYPRNRNNIEHTSTYKKVEKLFKKAVNQTRYLASQSLTAEFDYSVSRLLLGLEHCGARLPNLFPTSKISSKSKTRTVQQCFMGHRWIWFTKKIR